MRSDLNHPWNPASAYSDWLRAGRSAVRAELVLARKVVEGKTPSELEVSQAKRLRAAADGLRDAARHAIRYLEEPVRWDSVPAGVWRP